MSTVVRPIVRRHLVRYDDRQTATLCGLPVVREGKWSRLAARSAPGSDDSLRCAECFRLHDAESDDHAAEYVYEGVTA